MTLMATNICRPSGLSMETCLALELWFSAPRYSPSTRDPVGRHLAAAGYLPDSASDYSSTAAFVADLVLHDIRHRLPGGGEQRLGGAGSFREHSLTPAGQTTLHLLPCLLFRLNWATHGEHICWPADYYATWLPHYRRWIVTASSDTEDLWGVRNVALGWFHDTVPLREGARSVVLPDWRGELSTFCPFPWESVREEGAIGRLTAGRWRAEAWPDQAG